MPDPANPTTGPKVQRSTTCSAAVLQVNVTCWEMPWDHCSIPLVRTHAASFSAANRTPYDGSKMLAELSTLQAAARL